jgi:hypothetical protein
MRGIEQQPILAYVIILIIAVLVFMDRALLNLLPRNTILIGVAVIATIIYLAIRKKTSIYI